MGKQLFEKSGTYLLVRYHLGTMCFASFVLTILWAIREILDLFRQIKFTHSCLSFIGSTAEWLIIGTQALWELSATNSNYITALFGFGYCSATRRTIELTDGAAQASVGLVGNALVYMCVIMVGLVSATAGLAAFPVDVPESKVTLGLTLFLIGLGLAWMVLSVYVNITRALYVCICLSIEAKGVALGDTVEPMINKYVSMVPKFTPPPIPTLDTQPPILASGKRYEPDSDEEVEDEEEEQMVQIIEV